MAPTKAAPPRAETKALARCPATVHAAAQAAPGLLIGAASRYAQQSRRTSCATLGGAVPAG